MSDTDQPELETLREIDARFHRLFEAVAEDSESESTPTEDPLTTLRRARSQIDAALFAHQHRTDGTTLPESGSCILEWDPSGSPPRRLVLDPDSDGDSWTLRELEWTGTEWQVWGRTRVDDVAIRAPAAPRYPTPIDPPTIDTLIEWIRGGWTNPDPPALVFDATSTTEQGVVVAVNGELRYRERDSERWQTVTQDELTEQLQQRGQPTLQSLSKTTLTRTQFTINSPTDR